MARKSKKAKSDSPGRIKQFIETYRVTAKADPKLPWILLGTFALTLGVFIGVGALLGNPITLGILGFGFGALAATYLFGRRAQTAAYRSIEGQPGAAAAVLNSLRGGWTVSPGVAFNKNQDLVHRVIGRPGVILIAEGATSRTSGLLLNEKRKTARFIGEVPVHEFTVGYEQGQVTLKKLQREVMKLPKVLRPSEVTALRRRLEAIQSNPLPIPKGPLPKGARMPKAPRG